MAPKINKLLAGDGFGNLSPQEEDLVHQFKNIRTTPRDVRFPAQNQAGHCFNRYNEWLLCLKQTSDEDKCAPLRQYAISICPGEWVANWDEGREEGTFAGLQK